MMVASRILSKFNDMIGDSAAQPELADRAEFSPSSSDQDDDYHES
jgi:hypothetical protein